MSTLRSSSLFALFALALAAIGAPGCAASDDAGDDVQGEVVVAPSGITPSALGYVPRVVRSDFQKPAGSCVGNLCTANGVSWDCSGSGYCSRISF